MVLAVNMLGLHLVVLFALGAFAHKPFEFELVDNYLEDFKSKIDAIQKSALNYETRTTKEESIHSIKFDEVAAFKHAEIFDFIIVGGGTAGSVLASKLSEVPEWKILLLEAGDVENDATKIPRNWEILKDTPQSWSYKTTPQNYSCLELPDHRCVINSGKILGGTSAINNLLYTRGHPRDYDLWADLDNKGWCYSDVLPIFKDIENAQLEKFDKKYHRLGGRQTLQNPQFSTAFGEHVIKAAEECGYEFVDYNGKKQIGISLPQLITDCGQRSSAATSYLKRDLKRPNLVVKPLSQVLKVLIKEHIKEAQGVLYLHEGQVLVAKAEKEVVLAAGAINTPKILLLSGVGPKKECEKHDIETIVDLPVGKNLRIRPSFTGLTFIPTNASEVLDKNYEIYQYLKNGKGVLSAPGLEAVAFIKAAKDGTQPADYPDIELQFVNDVTKKLVKIIVNLNHPKSLGSVTLQDSDPLHHPVINPNFYTDDEEKDLASIVAGIQTALKISKTEYFQGLGLELDDTPVEACKDSKFGKDEYWHCAIKHQTVATTDAIGTTGMGPHDELHVVDNTLKVRGVHRLRVADAGVIPVAITGNIMGPSMMIGEKAAKLIIEDWE